MSNPEVCSAASDRQKDIIRNWLVIPLIGGIVITIVELWVDLIGSDFNSFLESTLVSATFWSVLANGNSIIVLWLDKRWTWLEHPLKRVSIGFTALFIYTVVASLLIIYVYVEFVLDHPFNEVLKSQGFFALLRFPLGITFFIALFQHGQGFLLEWRQAAIDVERLKNENLKSKFESLKSQVNPHFLFNSLNALTSLVYADQSKAVHFIQKLSQVYRYVLDHQNDEVVSLGKEIEFLKSFVYLNKIRFGENINVEYIGLDTFNAQESIPPVTLQMLVENCIKHNEISKANQLNISIERIDNSVTVKNNINRLNSAKQDSSGLGLSNIISRYDMLSDQKVEITATDKVFQIKIPILSLIS